LSQDNGFHLIDDNGAGPQVALPESTPEYMAQFETAIFMGPALADEAARMYQLSMTHGKRTLCVVAPESVLPDYLELIVGQPKLMDSFVIIAGDGSEPPPRVNEIIATIDALKQHGLKGLN
jgi:hypothetical protein